MNIRPSVVLFVSAFFATHFAFNFNLKDLFIFISGIGAICLVFALILTENKNKINKLSFVLLILGLFCLFYLRASLFYNVTSANDIKNINERIRGFEGVISSSVILKKTRVKKTLHQEFSLDVNRVFLHDTVLNVTGRVLIKNAGIINELKPGSVIRVKGFINPANKMQQTGDFDYGKYLIKDGISYFVWANKNQVSLIFQKEEGFTGITRAIKTYLANIVKKTIGENEPSSHFLIALLLGERTGLSEDLTEDFRRAGVIHVLALSGLHMGMIFAFFIFFTSAMGLKRKPKFIITALILIIFTIMVGLIYSLVRALIMTLVIIIVNLLERDRDYINSLFLAGFLIVFIYPSSVYSVSFQLSFGAVLGILLFYGSINNFFKKLKFPKFVSSSLSITISAQIFIFPLLLHYFSVFYFISFISNFIVVPIVMVIAFCGFLGFFIHFIPFIGEIIFKASSLLSKILFKIVNFFAGLNNFSIQWKMSLEMVISYYITFFIVFMFFWIRKQRNIILKNS